MNSSANGHKNNSGKISKISKNKIHTHIQNIKKMNQRNVTCPDLIDFIMNKRLNLKSFYDEKGTIEFLKSKQQALEKIELDNEINESFIQNKSKNENSLCVKRKGILKLPYSSKCTDESFKKHVSFDSKTCNTSTRKISINSNKSNFSNKSNNNLEMKNWEKANAAFKCNFFRKVKQDFTAVAKKIFQENDD